MKKKTTPTPHSGPVRLAIVGTGGMANHQAGHFKKIRGCKLVAGMDIDRDRAEAFCKNHGIPSAYTDLDTMLANEEIDAVTVVVSDAAHKPVSIKCLKQGKHVLCEKPLALNHAEAREMVRVARQSGKINMVNFSYRNWPAIHGIAKLVKAGRLGDLRHVEANYLQTWLTSPVWGEWRTNPAWLWRLSKKHGSQGALGDIGVHILDFATYPAGAVDNVYCKLKAFNKAPRNRIGEYKLDANDSAVISVEFKNGALGTIHTTRWASGHVNRLYLKISGTKGTVEFDSEKSENTYRICAGRDVKGVNWKEAKAPAVPTNFQRFITSIRTGINAQADFARGAEIQRILDACFHSDAKNRPVKV